jgi:hypothetical protein
MARIRTIKPDFWSDEKVSPLDAWPELLFIGLWNFADDMGRMAYSAQRLANQIFPGKGIGSRRIDAWVQALAEAELIRLYTVEGHGYIWIPGFSRHQRIDKPGHSIFPPHPKDLRGCSCVHCRINGKELKDNRFSRSVPAGTHRISESVNRGFDESENDGISDSLAEVGSRKESLHGESREDLYKHMGESESAEGANPRTDELSGENRRARRAALEEIAQRILSLLKVASNSNILDTITRSIEIRARSRECSIEAAGQEIAARAAWIAGEAAPEDWLAWFYDARYAYVAQGDKALTDRRIEARPVCGGSRCSEGWETVRVGDRQVSRRCPDCVKLWQE